MARPGEWRRRTGAAAMCPQKRQSSRMGYNSRVKIYAVLTLLLTAGVARADGESAVSVGLGWATFRAQGKPMDRQAPPTLSPDVGGALVVSYERSISGDFSLRGELAGGAFYGGAQAKQSTPRSPRS